MSKFDTHGGYFAPKDYLRVNEGGSHEENPNGGVQIGVDPEGNPNLLEEGEPVYKDYVYSDNIEAEKEFLEQNNLPAKYAGKLYSKIADDLFSEAEERPLDPISQNGLEALLGRLADAQEGQKQAKEQRDLEDELAQLSPEELDQLEAMLAEPQAMNGVHSGGEPIGPLGYIGAEDAMAAQAEQMPAESMPFEGIPMMANGGNINHFDYGGPWNLYRPETYWYQPLIPLPDYATSQTQVPVVSQYPITLAPAVASTASSPASASVNRYLIPYNKDINGVDFESTNYYRKFLDYMRANPNSEDSVRWRNYIQDEIERSGSKYKLKDFDDWSRLAEDQKVGPVHQATDLAARKYMRERMPFVSPDPYNRLATPMTNPSLRGNPVPVVQDNYVDPRAYYADLYTDGNVAPETQGEWTREEFERVYGQNYPMEVSVPNTELTPFDPNVLAIESASDVDLGELGRVDVPVLPEGNTVTQQTGGTPVAEQPQVVASQQSVAESAAEEPASGVQVKIDQGEGEENEISYGAGDNTSNVSYRSSDYELLPTWPRYAGAIGAGLLGLYNAFQKPDRYRVPHINPQLPEGRINLQNQVYNPIDQNMIANAQIAQGNATNRALRNSGLGPSTGAAILASDNNLTGNLGTGFIQAWDANNQRRNAVLAANNQAEAQRAQFDYTVDAARKDAINRIAPFNAQNDLMIQRLNNQAEAEKYQAISNQISNGLQALSGIGQENFAMNQVNTNPSFLGYRVAPNGAMKYMPWYSCNGGFLKKYKK